MCSSSNLNEKQRIAVYMAATGSTGREIAAEVGVTEETVSKWRQLPEFQAEVNSLLKAARDEAGCRLRDMTRQALDVIQEALANSQLPMKLRLDAAFRVTQICGLEAMLREPVGSTDPVVVETWRSRERQMEENRWPPR